MNIRHLAFGFAAAASLAVGKGAPAFRVGVYDSRVVAYAYFWGDAARTYRSRETAAAIAARQSGDEALSKQLSQALANEQTQVHLEVFSTAPADEAMAALALRIPAICQELGVVRLVSKWDAAALNGVAAEAQVDVTDRLVREFLTPNGQQRKTMDEIAAANPLPVVEAKALDAIGQM
jgi:hypothetical protein